MAPESWRRIETEAAFRAVCVGTSLIGDDLNFILHSDGRITGQIGDGRLAGRWYWQAGYFCRTATLDGLDLGLDCEVIEISPGRMRYTRAKGEGGASIVSIGRP